MPAELFRQQMRFTAWLRDPQDQPRPDDVPERRLQAYRELLTNNVASVINACFPVLQSLAGDERWLAWIDEFFGRHRCHSPIYRKIPHEFLEWLKTQPAPEDLPFRIELAQYEWMELALDIDSREIPTAGVDPHGDLLAGVPVINPLTEVLRYTWPVHRIGPEYRPAAPEAEPARIILVRDRRHEIGFLEINALVEQLVLRLAQNERLTGGAVLDGLARDVPAIPASILREGGIQALQELAARDIVLGTRLAP